ncbi:MAG: capsule assembly Wzi family protein [Gemmatimonadota bacterium]
MLPAAGLTLGDGPRTDPTAVRAGARVRWAPRASVGLWADPMPELGADGPGLPTPEMGAAWRVGSVRLTASHDGQRLEPGASGGVVLHDRVRQGRLEVATAEPVRLPWLLRHLGPFMISASGSVMPSDTLPNVGFFTGEFRLQPFPWLTLGLYRTAAVVNETDGETLGLRDLWLILKGTRSGSTANFDDQKASMSASVRARLLGVTVNPYFVWGWEDTWKIDEDPGTVLGVWLPAVPLGGQPVGLRYEYTAFGDDARIIWPWSERWAWREWYGRVLRGRNVYAEGDELLGHPLGGYGTEHRVELDLAFADPGLVVSGLLFTRDRVQGFAEDYRLGEPRTIEYRNLLYDEMPGRSLGASLHGTLTTGGVRLDGGLTVETGREGWDRVTGSVGATWLLP